jgi:GNAT superfamily N-acetyltransferase
MTSVPGIAVRRATTADRDAVVATVVAAFATDPAWEFITGGEIERVSPSFAGALFDGRAGRGTVWVADDCRAVAMWDDRTQPVVEDDHQRTVWADYRANVGEQSFACLLRYDDAVHAQEPAVPFWYLGVLATHPSAQGTGLASAVIAPVLALADSAGVDCWLETSKPTNTEFYERRGFTERVRLTSPDVPPTWWMRRPPALSR